ncbi:hypothetical protein B296_00055530 [Ensete ventricosum]|uniref:Uncharacterized protein n=1 Tax=Ensete ventricosum TaxID=4639 RepID=A0A426WW08_ENSVE|nr:hypothetical protein B296_00055530 [Ensete ventricosum]
MGLPLLVSQWAAAPCGLAAGIAYAYRWPRMLAAAPARDFGRGRPPPCSRPGRGWPALGAGRPYKGPSRGQPPLQRA